MTFTKDKIKKYTSMLSAFLILFFINFSMLDKFDDASFIANFERAGYSLSVWATDYWNTWSSRVICHGVNVMLLKLGGIWFGLINALFMLAMVALICRFARKGKNTLRTKAAPCLAFFSYLLFIPYTVRMEADLWKTATVIYLWGTVCALYCMYLALKAVQDNYKLKKYEVIFGLICAVYASNCEQSARLLIAYIFIIELYSIFIKKNKIHLSTTAFAIVALIGFILCTTAPGNKARDAAEILGSIAFYYGQSILEKGFFGVLTSVHFIYIFISPLMLCLSVAVLAWAVLTKQSSLYRALCCVPVGYFGLSCLFAWMKHFYPGQIIPFNLDFVFFDMFPLFPQQVSYSLNQWFASALAIFVCVLLGLLIGFMPDAEEGLFYGLLYGAAFAIIAVIGFTTAGRITGRRTVFPSAMLLIIVFLRFVANSVELLSFNIKD